MAIGYIALRERENPSLKVDLACFVRFCLKAVSLSSTLLDVTVL